PRQRPRSARSVWPLHVAHAVRAPGAGGHDPRRRQPHDGLARLRRRRPRCPARRRFLRAIGSAQGSVPAPRSRARHDRQRRTGRPRPLMEGEPMNGLVASGVVVRFGGLVALDGVDLQADRGRITGLIGPNGAGKTTMFNVICGFQSADEGTVELNGVDITRESPARRARLGIGRTFQRMELFRSLTVRENVALAAESAYVGDDPLTQLGLVNGGRRVKVDVDAITDELLHATGLEPLGDRLAAEISSGEGRLLELARALARRPRTLLLDEPSSGLDVK